MILTTSTAGTTMSDLMDRTLGFGYMKGTIILLAGVLTVLACWRYSEGTLSVAYIHTPRAELFYWTAILFSNTLGTALGDFLADDSRLGFSGGAALIGGLLGVVVIAAYSTRLDRVMLFWIAFVLTRPFGATFGDVLHEADRGGRGAQLRHGRIFPDPGRLARDIHRLHERRGEAPAGSVPARAGEGRR